MKDLSETNQKLLKENAFLKKRIKELDLSKSERERAEKTLRVSKDSMKMELDAILSPEGDERLADLELADILDIQVFQSMMDDFLTYICP